MAKLLPFQSTGVLISEIDQFIDRVAEAVMVLEQTQLHYLDNGADDQLDERLEQILDIEQRGDTLRRNIANVMYSQMLMPDTRGDVLSLLDEVDTTLDDCTHGVASLVIEQPEVHEATVDDFRAMAAEVTKAALAMLKAARAYFKEPNAVRDHVHKVNFHNAEATKITLRAGKAIYRSDLPLDRKQQLNRWLTAVRGVASHADDVAEQVAIFAVKRSY